MTKPRIGSKKYAKYILNYMVARWAHETWRYERDGDEPTQPTLRDGWFRLGAGVSRTAFLGPDGNVYKVDHVEWHGSAPDAYYSNDNRSEHLAILKHEARADMPTFLRLPVHHLFHFGKRAVQCMEVVDTSIPLKNYCDASRGCECPTYAYYKYLPMCSGKITQMLNAAGFGDVHNENYFPQTDGTVMCVDVGL